MNSCLNTLSNLRVFCAKARRCIRPNKRKSWKSNVSHINSQTPMNKIWKIVRRISGKPSTTANTHLKVSGITIEQPFDIANFTASTISYNSSIDHYAKQFRRFKAHQEKRLFDFCSDNSKPYNLPFTLQELNTAL